MKRTIWVDDPLQNEFGDPLSNLAQADNRCVQVKALQNTTSSQKI